MSRFTLLAAKWISIAAGLAAGAYLLWIGYIYLVSEAVIERHYTLPSSLIAASTDEDALARGRHLMRIAGCYGCHGESLEGRNLKLSRDLPIFSGNLRALASQYTDPDFERAIRRGLMPDARPIWLMPSETYAYMREKDVEDIIAVIRAMPPQKAPPHKLTFNWRARRAIVAGTLVPNSPEANEIVMPVDEGPRYEGGRYLATIACAQCHGGDLTGQGYAPDLDIALSYSRPQFFRLLREGRSTHGWLPVMSPLAFQRFRDFKDYEIMALYDYLEARKTLPPYVDPDALLPRRKPAATN